MDLHIVSFAVPFPPDYGGAIDVWNRMIALHAEGVRIHYHGFIYGRFKPQHALDEICASVHYYPRTIWPVVFQRSQPYIVSSRRHKGLLERLRSDDFPVLFEGIQCTGWAPDLKQRKLMLRAHNIEHQYYGQLARQANSIKSIVFNREAQCLEAYEKAILPFLDHVFCISAQDTSWFTQQGVSTMYLPPFTGEQKVSILPGMGDYLLYQGDLSIEINQRALLDLLSILKPDVHYRLVVAGRSGEPAFEQKLNAFPNLHREADVSHTRMLELIRNAQIIVVHSLHSSGMKLKLFPALFHGRHIIASVSDRTNSTLDQALHFHTGNDLFELIRKFMHQPFQQQDIEQRTSILSHFPDDRQKAREIIRYL